MNANISILLNGTIESLKSIIPITSGIDKPSLVKALRKTPMGVRIALKGKINGKIIIEGQESVFSKVGEAMYGMSLEGDMLGSFTGELGNMIAGHMATSIAEKGVEMDISTPTLLIDHVHAEKFDKALSLPVHFQSVGSFNIILLISPA